MKDMCVQTKNKDGSTDLVDILKFGTVEHLCPRGVLIFQVQVVERELVQEKGLHMAIHRVLKPLLP